MLGQKFDIAVTVLFVVAILLGLVLTRRIDLAFSSDLETFSGPRAYPGVILTVLLVLFGSIGFAQLRGLKQDAKQSEGIFDRRAIWSVGLFLALILFVATFEPVGYILTMVPLLILVAFLTGGRSPARVGLVAITLTALCLVIFRYGLATVLPEGVLGIDAIF
ncbi:MAG: tripartite tricarboxylate transporter TctB family protein [Pseudomonadota bacterium]